MQPAQDEPGLGGPAPSEEAQPPHPSAQAEGGHRKSPSTKESRESIVEHSEHTAPAVKTPQPLSLVSISPVCDTRCDVH